MNGNRNRDIDRIHLRSETVLDEISSVFQEKILEMLKRPTEEGIPEPGRIAEDLDSFCRYLMDLSRDHPEEIQGAIEKAFKRLEPLLLVDLSEDRLWKHFCLCLCVVSEHFSSSSPRPVDMNDVLAETLCRWIEDLQPENEAITGGRRRSTVETSPSRKAFDQIMRARCFQVVMRRCQQMIREGCPVKFELIKDMIQDKILAVSDIPRKARSCYLETLLFLKNGEQKKLIHQDIGSGASEPVVEAPTTNDAKIAVESSNREQELKVEGGDSSTPEDPNVVPEIAEEEQSVDSTIVESEKDDETDSIHPLLKLSSVSLVYEVFSGVDVKLGRSRKRCQIVIDDPKVSREHAMIVTTGPSVVVSDLATLVLIGGNAVVVNGKKISGAGEMVPLFHKDSISIGGESFLVEYASPDEVNRGEILKAVCEAKSPPKKEEQQLQLDTITPITKTTGIKTAPPAKIVPYPKDLSPFALPPKIGTSDVSHLARPTPVKALQGSPASTTATEATAVWRGSGDDFLVPFPKGRGLLLHPKEDFQDDGRMPQQPLVLRNQKFQNRSPSKRQGVAGKQKPRTRDLYREQKEHLDKGDETIEKQQPPPTQPQIPRAKAEIQKDDANLGAKAKKAEVSKRGKGKRTSVATNLQGTKSHLRRRQTQNPSTVKLSRGLVEDPDVIVEETEYV